METKTTALIERCAGYGKELVAPCQFVTFNGGSAKFHIYCAYQRPTPQNDAEIEG